MIGTAASFYRATLAVTTGLSAPFSNLAVIYKQQVFITTNFNSIHPVTFYLLI